jgi:hypothetical protein
MACGCIGGRTSTRYVDRFAFREAPLTFNWQDTLNSQAS